MRLDTYDSDWSQLTPCPSTAGCLRRQSGAFCSTSGNSSCGEVSHCIAESASVCPAKGNDVHGTITLLPLLFSLLMHRILCCCR